MLIRIRNLATRITSALGRAKPVQATVATTARYRIIRGHLVSTKLATTEEVEGFLDACGISPGSLAWAAAFSGVPIQVDGAAIRFELVDKEETRTNPEDLH